MQVMNVYFYRGKLYNLVFIIKIWLNRSYRLQFKSKKKKGFLFFMVKLKVNIF